MQVMKRNVLSIFRNPKIPEEMAEYCARTVKESNQTRMKYLIPPVIFALVAILGLYIYNAVRDGFTALITAYVVTDVAYLFFLAGFYVIWQRHRASYAARFNAHLYIVFFASLLWAAVLSILDQQGYNSMTCYIMAVLVFSIAFVIKPHVFACVQASVLLPLLIALPFFQPNPMALTGAYINTLFSSVLSIFISRVLYHSIEEAIVNKRVIETKNAELSQLVAQLKDLSETDPLTGLLNRRKFDEVIGTEWRRAVRNALGIVLIILDVDFFKDYNDTYGHMKGDECLVLITKAMKAKFKRANDYVARYGGEEFAIIMTNSDREAGILACERLLKSVLALDLHHGQSSVADVVTVSAGIMAMVPKESDRLEDFIQMVDSALYKAKQSGRNRYVEADSE